MAKNGELSWSNLLLNELNEMPIENIVLPQMRVKLDANDFGVVHKIANPAN
jgi:hypothetical protein